MPQVKRFLYYLLLIPALILSSCKDDDIRVFDKSSDARLSETLQRYNDVLTSAPYGWKTAVYPASGAYAFYFNFEKDGTVTSFSDISLATAGTPLKSTYRLKALQQPTLIFDTYTYLHLLADPDGSVNGGNDGEGLLSDFEFAIDSASTNMIYLKGTSNGTVVRLISVTEAEKKGFYEGEFKNSITRTINYIQANQNPYLDLDQKLPVSLNISQKIFTMLSVNANGQIAEKNVLFTFTSVGIIFKEPITYGNLTFQELLWDKDEENYYVLVSGQKSFLKNAAEPVTLIQGAVFENFLLPEGAVDNATGIPGQSDEFLLVYKALKQSLLAGPYKLTLGDMYFRFDNVANTLDLLVIIAQITTSRADFLATFKYAVNRDANGNTTFSLRANPTGNASLIKNNMAPFQNYLTADTFRFDQQFTGSVGRMGRMNDLTKTGFFFTGAIVP